MPTCPKCGSFMTEFEKECSTCGCATDFTSDFERRVLRVMLSTLEYVPGFEAEGSLLLNVPCVYPDEFLDELSPISRWDRCMRFLSRRISELVVKLGYDGAVGLRITQIQAPTEDGLESLVMLTGTAVRLKPRDDPSVPKPR